jgi:hypothetical protein
MANRMNKSALADSERPTITTITGANAGTIAVKGGATLVWSVRVFVVGATSSQVELYDGPPDTGTLRDIIVGTATGQHVRKWLFENGLYVKTTDSGGTMKVTVAYI